jgi:acyl-CoA dehydrogenase
MPIDSQLDWPFFEDRHRFLAAKAKEWTAKNIAADSSHEEDVNSASRKLVRQLGDAGWLKHTIGGTKYGAAADGIDTRSVCILREALSFHSGLADFAFALQGLGSGSISLFGSDAQKQKYLPQVANGKAIAALAISEVNAGSDVAAMQCEARLQGDAYEINGEKTWISNGGIADFYVLFARTGEAPGARGITAFIVDADTPGFSVAERIAISAPHPLARLKFDRCRIPLTQRLGESGQGFKVAMSTLDVFRTSVAAAALGLARRALHEALARSTTRQMFGQKLSEFQTTQAKVADMATDLDAAALLTYRAAWMRDRGKRVTVEAAMSKMYSTEAAQRTIDAAVQIFGALGVVHGEVVERLYREIRPLRIYEGATEVQQLIIARAILKEFQEHKA